MADRATSSINVRILLDEIKSNWSGNMDFDISTDLEASAGDGWVYTEKSVSTSTGNNLLTATNDDYLTKGGVNAAVAAVICTSLSVPLPAKAV